MDLTKKIGQAFEVVRGIEDGSIRAKEMVSIVHIANQFTSSIVLHAENKIVDVKSFLGLSITLKNASIYKLEIHGDDEEAAKKAMKDVFTQCGIQVEMN